MVEEIDPFENLSKRVKTIPINGKDIKIKPKVKDLSAFMLMGKEPKDVPPEKFLLIEEMKSEKLAEKLVEIIHRAYPKKDKEDIEALVLDNYTTVVKEMSIAMGLTTREELEKALKEEKEKAKKEKTTPLE